MHYITNLLLVLIAINAIVLPNAFQTFLATLLAITACISIVGAKRARSNLTLMGVISFITTIFFCMVGVISGATDEAIIQTFIIYIISPTLWILVIDLAWRTLGAQRIVNGLAVLSITAAISIGIYYYLFQNFGPSSVAFFGSSSNVHIGENYAGVRMHVPGSLIFLSAAFFSEPSSISNRKCRIVVLIALALAVFSSGRTAAVLAMLFGISVMLLAKNRHNGNGLLEKTIIILATMVALFLGLNNLLGLNAIQVMQTHLVHATYGDTARPEQISALLEGSINNYFLGSGHGLGVNYLRSNEYPWRYEAVYFALIFKLGVVGFMLTLYPLFRALAVATRQMSRRPTDKFDTFFASAFCASLVMGVTNPYIEAFSFQWMFLIPTYYFIDYIPRRRNILNITSGISSSQKAFANT